MVAKAVCWWRINMSFASILADKIVTYMAVTTLVLALVTFAVTIIW